MTVVEAPPQFECSICGEPSRSICVYCTKDACDNHLCPKCHRCSDCCECTVALNVQLLDTVTPTPSHP